jgi:hypothetical protein
MSTADITPEQMLSAIHRVPTGQWGEIMHVIESFQTPNGSSVPASPPVRIGTDLKDSGLIGIWSDRSDLGSGQEFAREMRRQAEQRDR